MYCFYFQRSFQKSFSFPRSVFQSIYAYPNRKNKSRKCFNIGLFRKNECRKTQFFSTVDLQLILLLANIISSEGLFSSGNSISRYA